MLSRNRAIFPALRSGPPSQIECTIFGIVIRFGSGGASAFGAQPVSSSSARSTRIADCTSPDNLAGSSRSREGSAGILMSRANRKLSDCPGVSWE